MTAFSLILAALPGTAAADYLSDVKKRLSDVEAEVNQLAAVPLSSSQLRGATHVEERLADGEMYFRLKDYLRASVLLTDIVETYPKHTAYPDALFLLAESLYHAGDYLGARSRFRLVLGRANEGIFRPYLQRALGRLIEIAIVTRDFDGVEEYFAQLSRLPTSEIEAATNYYRAKYLFSVAMPDGEFSASGESSGSPDQQKLEQARAAFESVTASTTYYLQARYFVGVIYTIRGQYEQAARAFQLVAKAKAIDAAQRTVADLAKLALGRLFYETDQIDAAEVAYQSLSRISQDFDVALYEIAWAYIRKGDSTEAERALEVLAVAAPESRYIPDGMLLRGNLLLRNGKYITADEVFEDVTKRFEPVREQLDEIYSDKPDPAAYFRQLVRENAEAFDLTTIIPPLALKWTELEGDVKHALQLLSDLSYSLRLVRETEKLASRLTAALASHNPVNIFPDLRSHRERAVLLRTRLERVRTQLIAFEEKESGGASGELAKVRKERRALEKLLNTIPSSPEGIAARSAAVTDRYSEMNGELSRLEVETAGLEARIVATDRFVTDTAAQREQTGGAEAIRKELEQHRGVVEEYNNRIVALRMELEIGQLQVGVGDSDFERDGSLRERYRALVERERELMRASGTGDAGQTEAAYRRVAQAEAKIGQQDSRVDQVVVDRVSAMRVILEEENANLEGYRERIDDLQDEAEVVIGYVARDNFLQIQKRFYELVLGADVGRVDVSWAEREEHRMRVELFTRERTRQIQALDDEFREIIDEKTERGN